MAREIVIAGAGTGSLKHLTPEVREAVNDADIIFSDRRFRDLIPAGKRVFDIMNYPEIENEDGRILLLVSGDPGIFSLMPIIRRRFHDENITVLPGISSLQAICSHAGETWNDAAILSGHGRSLSAGKFLNTTDRNRITILFCDRNISPSWACEKLASMGNVEVFIGSCLGSDGECISFGKPEDFAGKVFPEPSILLARNNAVYVPERLHLRDRDFLREEGIVMTNEAVRQVIISRLEMKNDAIFWDIGAGSGSISVSIGHEFPLSEIHAVEYNPIAASLTSRNARKFHLHNITVHNSHALDVISSLPEPSNVFIGGSNGELAGILGYISAMRQHVRVVIACVTLETLTEAYMILWDWENFEAVQISAVSSKLLSYNHTMMKATNPVTILSAEK